MGNALEQEIIDLYAENISSSYSINQIAAKLGKKYPYINKKVSFLIKDQIFKRVVVGRSHLCSLNLENDETLYLLILNEIKKKKDLLQKHPTIQKTIEYIEKISKNSDLGLAIKSGNRIIFVLNNSASREELEKGIMKQALKDSQLEFYSEEEFLPKLLHDKNIQENHTILHGYERYYECIKKIEDQLKLKYSRLLP